MSQQLQSVDFADAPRRAALQLVDRILERWDAAVREARKTGKRAAWRKLDSLQHIDWHALKELVAYLRQLNLRASATTLQRSDYEHTMEFTNLCLSDDAVGLSADQVTALREVFGEFPLPLDDPAEHRRVQRYRLHGVIAVANSIAEHVRRVRQVLVHLGGATVASQATTSQVAKETKENRGRKKTYNPKQDAQWVAAWKSKGHVCKADCAIALGTSVGELNKALDRHRHWKNNSE